MNETPSIFRLFRSGRRTLALEINRDGNLIVRAPFRLPFGEINNFIALKKEWIIKKQEKQKTKAKRIPLNFENSRKSKQENRRLARELIFPIVKEWAERYGFVYARLKISGARTLWGSCSGKGTLSFSWRLAMAPKKIIEYVVAHELAHLKHKNHAKVFWREVEGMVPEYKEYRKWLRENGHCLVILLLVII